MISILVPVRDPHDLDATLTSLRAACGRHEIEILTVDSNAGVPRSRALALARARGERIAIVEDHCRFAPGWLDELLAAEADVAGGCVANGRRTYVGWAQYFTRYAPFLPPQRSRATRLLPGCNALYKRGWLDRNAHQFCDGFWEAELNQSLLAQGATFHLCATATITQTQRRGAIAFIALRFRHGRCYGARRPQADRPGWRTVLIPAILFARVARAALRHDYAMWFLLTAPLIAIYQLSWTLGEATGYLAGAGNSCSQTD
jgi:hypothetical protein